MDLKMWIGGIILVGVVSFIIATICAKFFNLRVWDGSCDYDDD